MSKDRSTALQDDLRRLVTALIEHDPSLSKELHALAKTFSDDPTQVDILYVCQFIEGLGYILYRYFSKLGLDEDDLELLEDQLTNLSELISMHEELETPMSEVKLLNCASRAIFLVKIILEQHAVERTEIVIHASEPAEEAEEENTVPKKNLIKPSELVTKCSEYVIGQEHVKRAVATYLASYYNSIVHMENTTRPSLLIVGPSGTGKTYIVEQMAKALGKRFQALDATEFTPSGYQGRTLHSILEDIVSYNKGDEVIIFVDEIDKLTMDVSRDDFLKKVQAELLKVLESYSYDTEQKCCFIFAGAFEKVRKTKTDGKIRKSIGFGSSSEITSEAINHDDLVKGGLMRELVGRIGTIVETNPITDDMLYDLLTKPKDCVKNHYNRLFSDQDIKDAVSEADIQVILEKVSDKHRSLGVRGLKSVAEEHFRDRLYF